MHPAPSIILFTTLSGIGFGMLTFLGLGISAPTGVTAFAFSAIAYAFAGGGLIASTFHLGHPERALKAFGQWRSSWLSREAWAALMALAIMALYAIGLIFFETRWRVLGTLGGALALATVFATSMIYTQMKTVPRWNHWTTPVLFLAFALTGGALLTGRTSLSLWLLPGLAILQCLAWYLQDRRETRSDTSTATATGLGQTGTVRAFEPPHTGGNYLTREMVFRIARKHTRILRLFTVILAGILPTILLILPFNHWLGLAAVLCHLAGVLIQRWLFFAQARHTVGFYYGR